MCYSLQVKVVIIGQDPYHGPNQAHGKMYAFVWCVCVSDVNGVRLWNVGEPVILMCMHVYPLLGV